MGLFKYKTETGAAGAKSDLIPCIRLEVWGREVGRGRFIYLLARILLQ